MGPDPAVAAVRSAVRRGLADLASGSRLLVACSGGADSLALLAATVFESRRAGWWVSGVTVDHGLQPGSADRANAVVEQIQGLGIEAVARTVEVPRGAGPEASARAARYAALEAEAARVGAGAVLLGHTRDDQAETVLLGLARGSGARSLAGMARTSGLYRRPLLAVRRADTAAACRAEGLDVWEDPHNVDRAFARVRVRHDVLPVLEQHLGPGVGDALARTADLLRDDADALDALAVDALATAAADAPGQLTIEVLTAQPRAVRRRVLRRAALAAGSPATDLFLAHVEAVDALITAWHGQREVQLPGRVRVTRSGGVLRFDRPPVAG